MLIYFGYSESFEKEETKDIKKSKLLKEEFCFVFLQQTNYKFTFIISYHEFLMLTQTDQLPSWTLKNKGKNKEPVGAPFPHLLSKEPLP